MDFQTTITVIFAAFAIAEVLQVWLLRSAVVKIKERMDDLAPADKRMGTILAETAIDFMRMLNENKNGEAQVVGGFILGASLAAFDEVKGKIPMIGGGAQRDESLEKLAKRNPWVGIALGAVNTFGPVLQAKMNEKGGGNVPGKPSGRGNVGYG